MSELTETLNSIAKLGVEADLSSDSEDYVFMRAAVRQSRRAEAQFGTQCVPEIIEMLRNQQAPNGATKVFLSTLLRLLPTKQKLFNEALSHKLPSYYTFLNSNPQDILPPEVRQISLQISRIETKVPDDLVPILINLLGCKKSDIVTNVLKFIEQTGDQRLAAQVLKLTFSDVLAIKQRSLQALGAFMIGDEVVFSRLAEVALDKDESKATRASAMECLLGSTTSERQIQKDIIMEVKSETSDAELLEVLLDSGDAEILSKIASELRSKSLSIFDQTVLRRVARLQNTSLELRTTAIALLQNQNTELHDSALNGGQRVGLLAFRKMASSALAGLGHVGVFSGMEEMIDCNSGRDPRAVQAITWGEFSHQTECYGVYKENDSVDLQKVVARATEISSWRTAYDDNHLNQKGQWFKAWFCRPRYWETDCVGFTEHCYEFAGTNIVPNSDEFPLTPREQRDHMLLVETC